MDLGWEYDGERTRSLCREFEAITNMRGRLDHGDLTSGWSFDGAKVNEHRGIDELEREMMAAARRARNLALIP